MCIHIESELVKCTVLEAEMRRRLWWSLVLFDSRVGEMSESQTTELAPIWDCRLPLNVDDSDLRAEMKEPPKPLPKPTETLFAVVRADIGNFVRNSSFYLDFACPVLKPLAKDAHDAPTLEGGEMTTLERMIEVKYLAFCDPDNPLHFMTIWMARALVAKYHLVEYYSRCTAVDANPTQAQHDAAFSHAINLLECDTKLVSSPLIKGYIWLTQFYFPFPAYIQIIQALKKRPISDQADNAWAAMSENYETRFRTLQSDHTPLLKIFTNVVLQAWDARVAAFAKLGEELTPPKLIVSIRSIVAQFAQNDLNSGIERPQGLIDSAADTFPMTMPGGLGLGIDSGMYSPGGQAGHMTAGSGYILKSPFKVS